MDTASGRSCPACQQLPEFIERLDATAGVVRELVPVLRDLDARSRQLSAEVRSLLGTLRHLRREVGALVDSHPRCAVCGLLVGPGHVLDSLRTEPSGRERVCAGCWEDLRTHKTTAAAFVRSQLQADRDENGG